MSAEMDAPQVKTITEQELLPYVMDALHRNCMSESLPSLEASFPDFSASHLFRTLVLQQAWVNVCSGQLSEAAKLIDELGESPGQHFYEMWRHTTRNRVRALLYDYLHKQSLLSAQDEKNHEILLRITTKYPNTSFVVAQKLNKNPAMKIVTETAKLPPWQPIVDLTSDFNENKSMIFPNLFTIPDEPIVESPKYFVGNIALIEAQTPQTLKMLSGEGSTVEKLWILHCEHKVTEMEATFKEELEKVKDPKQLKCLEFTNTYFKQMNAYEQETLLDVLCKYGFFADEELNNFELLLIRICKSKQLFDTRWWSHTMLNFESFFKQFAKFCATKNLFMPFEMFVISHPRTKQIDISDVEEPLIKFIWDLWVKRDPSAATLSCMQYIAKSNSTDPVELWQALPSDSLAPLASFVWNKDPKKFEKGSPETEALSERLKSDYPLLASLVKGEIPHPPSPQIQPPPSKWRSPIFTSKCDLELHDLIASHFEYDFSKVFTDYYGKTPGQPPFPHFDHPELITAPSEPPYVHYVKSMLPVSAFQQATEDGVAEAEFKNLCLRCMREAMRDKQIRLAALTFIELTDQKFGLDSAIDYKLALAIYDRLSADNEAVLVEELSKIFSQKCQVSAKNIQKKLDPNEIEPFLLSALLGVRCSLPLDYSAISHFAQKARPAELLLYIDRAEEIGAHYEINEIVKIIKSEMPENPLKEHLLFHLTQTLPPDEDMSNEDIQPALVVFRAVRRTDQPPYISLLQEALNRKQQLYALLATSVEDADLMTCALVTLLTMTDAFSFDVANPPSKEQMSRLFLQVVMKLLLEGKSEDLIQALELFSETSLVTHICHWYHAVEIFTFRRAEIALEKINSMILDNEIAEDCLLGTLIVNDIIDIMYPLEDALAKHCAAKSQVHLFRYLQLISTSVPSSLLKPRVELAKVIEEYDNFRRAIMQCDLLGDFDKIVSDLVLHHSLALGQAAAACLGTSAATATQQWLKFQYSAASDPSQVLEVHSRIAGSISDADPLFFVALFAALLPYAQPSLVSEILRFARKNFTPELSDLGKQVDALLLHTKICAENSIEVKEQPESLPSVTEIIEVLFPGANLSNIPRTVPLSISSPILYSINSLKKFFETSIDRSIDVCLDARRVDDAKLLCEWRARNPQSILLLEAVQHAIDGTELTYEAQTLLSTYGQTSDMCALLESIARDNGWRFMLIALHFKAAKLLSLPTNDLLSRKTTDFLKSELPMSMDNWELVQNLISVGKVPVPEVADCLVESFTNVVTNKTTVTLKNPLNIDEFGENFTKYARLCENHTAVGERLFGKAKELKDEQPLPVLVNLLLHSALCTSDVDECAEMLDTLLEALTSQKQLDLIIKIVSVFPDPALLPRFFQYLIAQNKLGELPHRQLSEKVGRVIMNCARHVQPFEPKQYFDLTLNYLLYRDHAELQMECGTRLLAGTPDHEKLQEASRHFLLALAYFLHEKCYSLSMECLKKLSLISLQFEVSDPPVLHLEQSEVLQLMCTKDFPFALTVAVAYDMDIESNWAEAIYEQSIKKKGDDFLQAFQYFRPITSNLCNGVVKKFRAGPTDEGMKERMKHFLVSIPNLVERYRIAQELEFYDQIDSMKELNPVVCEWCEKALMNNQ